jgi:DNA polymerase-3 subunit epsilon
MSKNKMRQIILDTETTGLYPDKGHRIVEIAAIEMINRKMSDRKFHRYLNPEREVEEDAARVHGLTLDRLQHEAKFAEIAPSLLEFLSGAELIAHNAPFDIGFINKELELAGLPKITTCCPSVIDTLRMAKDLWPGKKNNLNALCDRYEIDNSHRTLHGALLDTELLGEVYLAMTRGQDSLLVDEIVEEVREDSLDADGVRLAVRVLAPTAEEITLHAAYLTDLDKASKGNCLWQKLEVTA